MSDNILEWNNYIIDYAAPLGDGSQADVFRGIHINGDQYALKIVKKARCMEIGDIKEQLMREIAIHSTLQHPHIVRMYGTLISPRWETVLVLDYVSGGDLMTLLSNAINPLPIEQVRLAMQQICEALIYCHSRNVVHRDLKLENILCDVSRTTYKLADFGHCASLLSNVEGTNENLIATTTNNIDAVVNRKSLFSCVGTLDYAAPEMLLCVREYSKTCSAVDEKGYDERVDIWSLGVMLFELQTGTTPFYVDRNFRETFRRIVNFEIAWNDGVPIALHFTATLDACARDLISKIFVQRDTRLSIAQILEHDWFSCEHQIIADRVNRSV